jgi:hypothetical protein
MNKELRKKVETELASVVKGVLEKHNPSVAAEISKQIREGVKFISKKFVKHLPSISKEKSAPVGNNGKKPVSSSAKKAKAAPAKKRTVKTAAVKNRSAVKKAPAKAKVKPNRK